MSIRFGRDPIDARDCLKDPEVARPIDHNLKLWKRVVGSAALLEDVSAEQMQFDPIEAYWYRPERRVLVAYFAQFFATCYDDPDVEAVLWHMIAHFDTARHHGDLPRTHELEYVRPDTWPSVAGALIELGKRLDEDRTLLEQWRRVRGRHLRRVRGRTDTPGAHWSHFVASL